MRFVASESGTTAIEYAVMSFIAVAVIAVVASLGETLGGLYQSVYDKVAGVIPD
jgi:Flp pilus assembly pilin Flp